MPADPTLEVRIRVARPGSGGFTLDATFQAPPGVTILFGPSGAGKSTALCAIAGIVRPDQGRIALGDQVWFDSAAGLDRPIHRRGVALVFQSLALFPHLTALGNVVYGVDPTRPRSERLAIAARMLERMRVPHLAHRRPRSFSGGEAQRVALARAFASSPRVMLLDEPFSALDRPLREALAADLRALAADARIPILHVTHSEAEARALGDRVVRLVEGRIEAIGRVEDLSRGA